MSEPIDLLVHDCARGQQFDAEIIVEKNAGPSRLVKFRYCLACRVWMRAHDLEPGEEVSIANELFRWHPRFWTRHPDDR